MRYLTLTKVIALHDAIIQETGGAVGIRDLGASSPPWLSREQLSAASTCIHRWLIRRLRFAFSLVTNHPFVDGNKRAGHAAMETFLLLNGSEIEASVDEQERLMLDVAAGRSSRNEIAGWLRAHIKSLP